MNNIIELSRWSVVVWISFSLIAACSGPSATRVIQNKDKQPSITFHRALKKKGGTGGFAYKGVRKKYQIEDTVLSAFERAPQASEWFASEKAFYQEILNKQKFDILVVPFQTQWDGVDPIGRSIMSYRLAAEIEMKSGLRVAPLPLVHPALGSHARFYEDADVYALARQIGVSTIVWGFAGTREDQVGRVQSLDVRLVCQKKEAFGSPEGSRSQVWTGMGLRLNQLPSLVFEEKLSEIISFITNTDTVGARARSLDEGKQPSIPQTPEALFDATPGDPITRSYYYQYMGMLIPPRAEYHRQHMFVRSLTVLAQVDPNHPDYAILKARAYHHLNRRPAAIAALGQEDSDRGHLLRQIINGSLPELNSVHSMLDAPSLDGFFALVEYASLMDRYTNELPAKHIAQWIERYPHWQYFFEIILNDGNGWSVPTNRGLNNVLDKVYPMGSFSLERSINKLLAYIQAEADGRNQALAFQDHVRKSLSSHSDSLLIGAHTDGPSLLDHHLLLEGVGASNLLKRLEFLYHVQCLPKESMNLCREYLNLYKGHPYFTIMKAKIQRGMAATMWGEEKQRAMARSGMDAALGLWWYGRQGWAFSKAISVLYSDRAAKTISSDQRILHKRLMFGIASDYPFIPNCARQGFMRRNEDLIHWRTTRLN